MAGMIVANCVDIFEEIKNLSLKCKTMYSKDNNSKVPKEMIYNYVDKRLMIWMRILQKPLTMHKNQRYYFENRITQADLALFNILDGILEWLGNDSFEYYILNRFDIIKKHYNNMLINSNGVKKLLKRQKQENVLWWPYYGIDRMGILLTGKWMNEKRINQSKL